MNKERKQQYDETYMRMAYDFGQLSHAVRSKVGCIIVSENDQIISQGYNGMPRGMNNICEYNDENGGLHTNLEVLHAETNALMKCARDGGRTQNARMYITMSPCFDCAKTIIQAGIKEVYYGEVYRDETGLDLLHEMGIPTYFIPIKQYDYVNPNNIWYAVNKHNKSVLLCGDGKPVLKDNEWQLENGHSCELRDESIMNITSFGDQEHHHTPVRITK